MKYEESDLIFNDDGYLLCDIGGYEFQHDFRQSIIDNKKLVELVKRLDMQKLIDFVEYSACNSMKEVAEINLMVAHLKMMDAIIPRAD